MICTAVGLLDSIFDGTLFFKVGVCEGEDDRLTDFTELGLEVPVSEGEEVGIELVVFEGENVGSCISDGASVSLISTTVGASVSMICTAVGLLDSIFDGTLFFKVGVCEGEDVGIEVVVFEGENVGFCTSDGASVSL